MKVSFKFAASLTAIVVTLAPQITLARTPAETKYLADLEHVTKTLGSKLTRIHASTPISRRLRYGYGACQALDRGTAISNLNESITFNGKTSANEKMYEIAMQTFAIHDLCPEYKSLLSK